MTTEAAPPAASKTTAGTEYVILEKEGKIAGKDVDVSRFQGPSWVERGRYTARSANEAIRAHSSTVTGNPVGDGATFVAIPARSWQPTTVTVETKTTIKLG